MIRQKRAFLGFILIAIGVIILLKKLDILPESLWWLFRWYTIIIVVGIYNLLTGKRGLGIVLCVVGGIFLFERLDYFDLNWSYIWPAALIGLGLLFIFRNSLGRSGQELIGDSYFDSTNILGGGKIRVTSSPLKGGKITCIMGGAEIDLTRTDIEGEAILDLFTFMGGAEIRVPDHWNVVNEMMSIMGGFEDKKAAVADSTGPTLRIKGTTIMGGCEVKS